MFNLQQAIKSKKKFQRSHWDSQYIQYFEAKTGPHKDLVDCDYFIIYNGEIQEFSTSIDLYPEDIFAIDYILFEN